MYHLSPEEGAETVTAPMLVVGMEFVVAVVEESTVSCDCVVSEPCLGGQTMDSSGGDRDPVACVGRGCRLVGGKAVPVLPHQV